MKFCVTFMALAALSQHAYCAITKLQLDYSETSHTTRKIKLSCSYEKLSDGYTLDKISFNLEKDATNRPTFVELIGGEKKNFAANDAKINDADITVADEKSIFITPAADFAGGNFMCFVYEKKDGTSQNENTKSQKIEAKITIVTMALTNNEKDREKSTFKSDDKLTATCKYDLQGVTLQEVNFRREDKDFFNYKAADGTGSQTDKDNFKDKTVDLDTGATKKESIVQLNIKETKDTAKGKYVCSLKVKQGDKDVDILSDSTDELKYISGASGAVVTSLSTMIVALLAFVKVYY